MRNILIKLSIAILLLSQYACDKDNRGVLANNYLKSQIDSASNHLLAFSNFEKVDGIERQKESLTYEMTFKGFVGAVRDCYWDGYINSSASASSLAEGLYGSSYGIGRNGLLDMNISLSLEELNQNDSYTRQYRLYKKGDGHFVKGYIIFEKRDSGWQIIEMDIKHDEEATKLYKEKSNTEVSIKKVDTTTWKSIVSVKKYGGIYENSYDGSGNSSISIYPETENNILFYVEISFGAPSYNSGALYGRVEIQNGIGTFYTKNDYDETGCKLIFKYTDKGLTIKTIESESNCHFGNGVAADGFYSKRSEVIPDYFEDREGTKVFFKNTKPETYNN